MKENDLIRRIDSPSYLRVFEFIFLGAVFCYFGKSLFVPMCYGLLIAMVLYPLCKWLEVRRWPRGLAIAACLLIVAVLFLLLFELLILQLNAFRKDLPDLMLKLKPAIQQLSLWVEERFGFDVDAQNSWVRNNANNLASGSGTIVKNTVLVTVSTFLTLFLVPVYTALFLYNRSSFVKALEEFVGERFHSKLALILRESIHTYFNFIKGTVLVYIIVGVLNSIGLMALGIKHAMLFGMLTAVMTIIPYIGIFVSALLPISVALITKDSIWYSVGVVAVFSFVQYLEANVIFPKIVATQLKVSTWATLVAIIAGGLLWGIAGMILFVPFVGILKIVADNIPQWKPLHTLLSR